MTEAPRIVLADSSGRTSEKCVYCVIRRTVRGLPWHHYGLALPPDTVMWTHNNPDVRPIQSILTEDTHLVGVGGDVYRYGVAVEDACWRTGCGSMRKIYALLEGVDGTGRAISSHT